MNNEYEPTRIKVPRFKESAGYYTTEKRSKIMSKIKAKNTKPEILFRKALYGAGVRYRIHCKHLPGNPDIANQGKKFVVFVDGEFWHGYNWEEKKHTLKKNRDFWIAKIERNIQRDQEVVDALEAKGYKVFRFWENEVYKNLGACLQKVLVYLSTIEKQIG
jgi:DNA mismatch endonuclease (patch repair protein)